jgi:hypothetical protein
MEAIPNTVGELLGELFPGCDIAAGLTRVVTVVEAFANQMQVGIEQVAIPLCEWFDPGRKCCARAGLRGDAG